MDKHTYKDTDILINNYNIRDKDKLQMKEQEIVSEATQELLEFDISMKKAEDYRAIHKYIFGDIYPWAGEYRTVSIIKSERILYGQSVEYGSIKKFDKCLNSLFDKALRNNPEIMDIKTFKNHIRKLCADIWRVHSFREGNTRTISIFADRYCHQYGYIFNSELIQKNAQYFRVALVLANAYNDGHQLLEEDEEQLKKIFDYAITRNTET